MQTPATSTATLTKAGSGRGRVHGFLVASGPALTLYAASRLFVLAIFAVVARVQHHALGHYLTRWDSRWYIEIARHGYAAAVPHGHGAAAQVDLGFFPLRADRSPR